MLRSRMLQKLLDLVTLFRAQRTEATMVVDEDHLCALEVDNHIRLMIPVHITERECDRYQIAVRSKQLWAHVDACMRCITAGHLDNFNMTMQIDSNKMTGYTC